MTRRSYIDWARGLAVLIMIEAHVLDSWTLRSDRDSLAFGYLNLLGGYAAPLFLWLAGVALVLSAERSLARGATRSDAASAVVRRGLQIFVLAFLFRLQAFVVSPGNPLVSLLRVDILNIMGPALAAAGFLWGVARGPRSATVLCGAVAVVLAMVTPLARVAPRGFLRYRLRCNGTWRRTGTTRRSPCFRGQGSRSRAPHAGLSSRVRT